MRLVVVVSLAGAKCFARQATVAGETTNTELAGHGGAWIFMLCVVEAALVDMGDNMVVSREGGALSTPVNYYDSNVRRAL